MRIVKRKWKRLDRVQVSWTQRRQNEWKYEIQKLKIVNQRGGIKTRAYLLWKLARTVSRNDIKNSVRKSDELLITFRGPQNARKIRFIVRHRIRKNKWKNWKAENFCLRVRNFTRVITIFSSLKSDSSKLTTRVLYDAIWIKIRILAFDICYILHVINANICTYVRNLKLIRSCSCLRYIIRVSE